MLILSSLRVLVLDEADRLLGEGFEVQLRQILAQVFLDFFGRWMFFSQCCHFNCCFSVISMCVCVSKNKGYPKMDGENPWKIHGNPIF